jgi:hypothetical protein
MIESFPFPFDLDSLRFEFGFKIKWSGVRVGYNLSSNPIQNGAPSVPNLHPKTPSPSVLKRPIFHRFSHRSNSTMSFWRSYRRCTLDLSNGGALDPPHTNLRGGQAAPQLPAQCIPPPPPKVSHTTSPCHCNHVGSNRIRFSAE